MTVEPLYKWLHLVIPYLKSRSVRFSSGHTC